MRRSGARSLARFLRWATAGVAALGLTFGALPIGSAQPEPAPFEGKLLFLNQGEIWQLDLPSGEPSRFLRSSSGTIRHMAYSPDRKRLAYAVVFADDMFRIVGSRIVVSDADGSNPTTVVDDVEPGFWVGWLSWTDNSSSLVYAKVNPARAIERVERVDLETGDRTLLLDFGSAPSASPSSSLVAYQTRAGLRWDVWALDSQTGEKAELVKADWFQDADHPAFSPDGNLIAFVAAGAGPLPGERAAPPAAERSASSAWGAGPVPSGIGTGGRWLGDLLGLPVPRLAVAHDLPGVFFDLWSIRPSGAEPRRVAQLFDLQPEFAWSPSGRHIAAMGGFNLQIVDVETGATRFLLRPLGSGPLSWGAR